MAVTELEKKINRISRTVCEKAFDMIEDMDRFYIALWDRERNEVSFPLAMENRKSLNFKARPFQKKMLPDQAIAEKHSIICSKNELLKIAPYSEGEPSPAAIICSPMKRSERVLGAVVAEKRSGKNAFRSSSIRIVNALSRQTGVAIENVMLFNEQIENNNAQKAVHDISVIISEGIQLGEKEILKLIKDYADKVMDTGNMYIALYEPDPSKPDIYEEERPEKCQIYGTIHFELSYQDGVQTNIPSRQAEIGKYGRTEVILATRKGFLNKTTKESENWYRGPGREEFIGQTYAAWLGVPMITGGKVIGVIATYHKKKEYLYTEDDKQVLSMMANQAAVAIENSRLYNSLETLNKKLDRKVKERTEQLEKKNKGQEAVHNISVRISGGIQLGEKEILKLIKQYANDVMDTDNMYIALYEPDPSKPDIYDRVEPEKCQIHGTIHFELSYQDGVQTSIDSWQAKLGKYGRTEVILATRKGILSKTKKESEKWYKEDDGKKFIGQTFGTWLGVPMITGGKVIGVIATYHKEKEYLYTEDDQQVLSMMASQAAVAIENSRLYNSLETLNKELENNNKELLAAQHTIAQNERSLVLSSINGDFIHKANNLVGPIHPWVSLLKREYSSSSPRKFKIDKYLDKILESTKIILEEAHSLRNPLKECKSKINIEQLVGSIISQVELMSAVTIDYQAANDELNTNAIERLLATAIYSVIQNSVKAITDENSVKTILDDGYIGVKINKYEYDKKNILIKISDNGCGIASHQFDTIFDYGISNWKTASGTGYGLWRAKNIIQDIDGKIWLNSSELNKGSEFCILLPIAEDED